MSQQKILILEEGTEARRFLVENLQLKGFEVKAVDTGQKALVSLKEENFDFILSEIKLSDCSGLEILKKVKELSPKTQIIILTSCQQIESAVEAMHLGAYYYLMKPFTLDTLEAIIHKAKKEENCLYKKNYPNMTAKTPTIIGKSHAIQSIIEDVEKIAKSAANVLITGDSGTGKEVVAHLIHFHSLRTSKPFIKVNCAAVPETLIESEFFGHEKGSFTGANQMHQGRFELADGGSLLLDEITEVPLGMQAKLLRAIQEQEFERVGGVKPICVDVRIISTSNRNMQEALANKKIREDLYYRLNVMPIHLPPLCEREEDSLLLAEYFLEKFSCENRKTPMAFTDEAKERILKYKWPGNVREVANVIERAVVLNQTGQIESHELYILDAEPTSWRGEIPLEMTLQELEKKHIIETLQKNNNNRTKTALELGISVKTLRNKLQDYQ